MRYRLSVRLAATAATLLCACATLQPMETAQKMLGSPQSAVRDTFGAPSETYQLANGTSRWIYSKQPMALRSTRQTLTPVAS